MGINRTTLDGYTKVNITDQLVTILNQTEMESWFGGVLRNAQTSLSVKGKTQVHVGALHYDVNIDKTEMISTLDDLEGFGFGDLELVLPADADGTNVKGSLTLPNWSPLTIGLGNVSLNVLSGPVLVGIVHIQDVVAPPGNTTLDFRGQVFIADIVKNIGPIIQSQASAIIDGNLNISASGNASVVNGQHIGYVENVLNNQVLSTEVPILELATQLAGGLLSSNNSLGELGTLLGSLLGNITGLDSGDGSSSNGTDLGGILGNLTTAFGTAKGALNGAFTMARLLSLVSKVKRSG